MSKAAELIAGLQTEAQFDSAGSFSLDREKAREKMRQFQLADPHRYVLLLVEAAVLRGATTISFEIDSDDMRMRFDAGLTWEDLQELYASLFVDRSSVEVRSRRELALACNAVMALNPRWVRIESVTLDQGQRPHAVSALLRPDAEDEITQHDAPLSPPTEATMPPWTTIHVKERFRPGLLVRFLNDLGGKIPEERLIRERCAFSSCAITLDGVRVSSGLPDALIAGARFEAEHMQGAAGFERSGWGSSRSAMVLLSNGVEIATHELSDSIPGLWFWVDCARFRKDVSQGDVVRTDPTYEATLKAIGAARDQVLGNLVRAWAAGDFTEQTVPTSNAVFDLIRDCFIRWGDPQWLVLNESPLSLVAGMPIWRTVDRRWLSPRALVERADPERGIMYTNREFDGVTPQDWGPVVHVLGGTAEAAGLLRVYPEASSVTEALEREVPWELNRRRWRSLPHAIDLPRGTPGPVVRFEQGEVRGCASLRPGQRSSVRIVLDGCLLCELELDLGFIGVCAVITGPFQPIRDYTRPRHDHAYATALMLLLTQLPGLIQLSTVAGAGIGGELGDAARRCVLTVTRPRFAFEWLSAFGFEAELAKQLLVALGEPKLTPEFGLGSEGAEAQPNALARAISFVTVDQRRVTLVDIDHDRHTRARQPGKVLFVERSAPISGLVDELLIHADADDRRLLIAAFGHAALHNDTKAYGSELGRRRFEAKPQRFASPPAVTWTTRVEQPGDDTVGKISGFVGIDVVRVRDWDPSAARRVKIEVLTDDRSLCVVEERSWLPGVEAVLAWERAPTNENWDALTGSKQPLIDAVESGLVEIILACVEAAGAQRPADDTRRLLWLAMLSPFVSVEHVRAWRSLRRHYGADHAAAVAAYLDVMTLFPGIRLPDLREAITMLLDDGAVPTREAILSLSGRAGRANATVTNREFHRQLLECYAQLEAVPMVALTSGKSMSLAQLTVEYERSNELGYVEDPSLRWDGDERAIVCADDIDHVALIRLFGRERLTEASAWIHERRHQQRFESRARLEQIRVADHDRLVGVEIDRDEFVGELAIPRWTAGEGGSMRITLCHDRRVVEELEIHAGVPVIGIVDDPHAELTADYASVNTTSARMAALRLMLSEVLSDQLLPALAHRYPSLDEHARGLARSWIFAHWRRHSPRAGDLPNRLSPAGQAFAKLELFEDVDGRARTLEQLTTRAKGQGCLYYVHHHHHHAVAPRFPVVHAHGPTLAALEHLFAKIEDFSGRWRDQVTGAKRRAAAPDLPSLPITALERSLASAELNRHGLQGSLWLPDEHPFKHAVAFGSEAKVVELQRPLELLPAQGVVTGTLDVDDRFETVELSGAQRRYLDARIINLYSTLLSDHQAQLARPETVEFSNPEVARRRAVAIELLRTAVVNLARARLRGDSFDAILGNLERRLNEEPLLRLATGALISSSVACRVRPLELAYLKIWDPDVPGFDPVAHAQEALDTLESPPSVPDPELTPAIQEPADDDDPLEFSRSDLEVMAEELGSPVADPVEVTPIPAPLPEPEPEPDYVGELLERVRAELRLLRSRAQIMLTEGLLDCIHAEPGPGRELVKIDDRVIFDSEHPRFVRALADPDPIWVSFLASVAYTALNRWLDEVTDEDELAFHAGHARLLMTGTLAEPSGDARSFDT
ncbi:hypothetical protein [Enhygromyxa salina]|uniref:Uncharacterized protein n=1 Tax=Enhygromyxa salina TaxID=215803 RepID=A0A2S9XN41_9BACT|nr:hypothetical protein [Enhygromyxa salina]PRP94289.1 hypothetical protein ENSA7_78260 [Enhygromyxa salina]